MRLVYIAGPFRAKDGWELHQNILKAERWAWVVAKSGAVPVCPHTLYRHYDRTLTDTFWIEATRSLLFRCDAALFVPGWVQSTGAIGEMKMAKELKLPVFSLEPGMSEDIVARWLGGEL